MSALSESVWYEHLTVARHAVEGAGAALLRLPRGVRAETKGDQLKTAADQAAEGWVLGYLKAYFADDAFLAEEDFETQKTTWTPPTRYWTVDALDGTRSFVDGFAGFCVQVAYVVEGVVRVGVVYEPVLDQTYFAVTGAGAYRQQRNGQPERLSVHRDPRPPRFVDSTRPAGTPGVWFERKQCDFVELGSIGLKICRVADGSADVFLKRLQFKLWDVAPGALILEEAGGRLGLWDGSPIPFAGSEVYFRDILASRGDWFDRTVAEIAELEPAPKAPGHSAR